MCATLSSIDLAGVVALLIWGVHMVQTGVTRVFGLQLRHQPNWTADDLKRVAVPAWIVDGDYDEAIKRGNTEFMAARIPDAGLVNSGTRRTG